MPDDLATAVIAYRRELMNSAFKAVEDVIVACFDNLEGLIVIVPADFALCHWFAPRVTRSSATNK